LALAVEQVTLYRAVVGDDEVPATATFASRLREVVAQTSPDAQELNDLGDRLFRDGAYAQARECFALATSDTRALGARANLGRCELRLGRPAEAETIARSLLAADRASLPGAVLLAEALMAQRRHGDAVQALQEAIAVAPEFGALHRQLGEACEQVGDVEQACVAYERAVALDDQDIRSLRSLVFTKRRIYDWRGLDSLSQRIKACVMAGRVEISPFDFLAEGASSGLERACAETRAKLLTAAAVRDPLPTRTVTPAASDRLRVGFVSHGFGEHPVGLLAVRLFELLRSSALEIHLFATSDETPGATRSRLMAAADRFHPVAGLSGRALAERIREEGIDVLVDMEAYCNSRAPAAFAYRPAPVQVNWLVAASSIGGSFMDYVIADPFVLPPRMQRDFAERVVYLPRCFQCTDTARVIGDPPSREACGLPAEGMVYACFNAGFKLNPRSFGRMMRILAGVPGSVLWLLRGPGRATERLADEARRWQVDPSRLVYMDRLPNEAYLTRYRHVDLFLDTENYNAHTTGSDALWAGCPVLTRPGETFASRVGGSFNHYLGMPELTVATDDAFVAAAVRLGLDEAHREALRRKVGEQKALSSLFRMDDYAKDFAALLARMAAHHRRGGLPRDFAALASPGHDREPVSIFDLAQ
jgi:predicted O-linked N-acetylglucosamine transferase (SPINDLY family)